MKNILEERDVTKSNVGAGTVFTFAASAKAFKIFIDGIYSDKVRAIIRELWTNAYDAHIEAGKPEVPFTCTLPTVLEPELVIRDSGRGLSYDFMINKYTVVFHSTKDESDDFVGSLGLGRLSAFAYTDAYTVNSYTEGFARSYAIFINQRGEPEVTLMSERDIGDEPEGLEIRFPVNIKDCTAFWNAAKFTAVGFQVKPLISNAHFVSHDIVLSGERWATYRDLSGVFARQGCVIYPLDKNIVHELGNYASLMDMKGLVIDFPIGSLDFNASREALGYNDKTRIALKEGLEATIHTMTTTVQQAIDKATTWYEAYIKVAELRESGFSDQILSNLIFKNGQIMSKKQINNNSLRRYNVFLTKLTVNYYRDSFRPKFENSVNFIPYEAHPIFAIKRGTKAASARISMYCKGKNIRTCYVISYEEYRSLYRIRKIMGMPPVIEASSLPAPVAQSRKTQTPVEKGKVKVRIIEKDSSLEGMIDIGDKGYYSVGHRGELVRTSKHKLQILQTYLFNRGCHQFDKVAQITLSQESRFKAAGWREITSFRNGDSEIGKVVVQVLEADMELPKSVFYSTIGSAHLDFFGLEDVNISDIATYIGTSNYIFTLKDLFLELHKHTEVSSYGETYVSNIVDYQIPKYSSKLVDDIENIKAKIKEVCPILSLIGNHCIYSYMPESPEENIGDKKIFIDYLKNTMYTPQLQIAA